MVRGLLTLCFMMQSSLCSSDVPQGMRMAGWFCKVFIMQAIGRDYKASTKCCSMALMHCVTKQGPW